MRKCKICEIGNVEGDYYICNYCGWEADPYKKKIKIILVEQIKCLLINIKSFAMIAKRNCN